MTILFALLAVIVSSSIYYFAIWMPKKKLLVEKVRKIMALPVRNWDVAFLESKRKLCDPKADNVIKQIIEHSEIGAVNSLLGKMMRNHELVTDGMPPEVIAYFKETQDLPSWADPELIKLGEKVYLKHGGSIAFLLMFKSLPECYACAKGAEVLYRTGRLNEQSGAMDVFSRRIAETAQFVVNAMAPGGLSSNGKGIATAQKIRLIHASMRYYLKSEGWNTEKFDEPINQQDMTGTLMSFSALAIEGLEMLGVELSDIELEAYHHCWKIIGYTMGIDEDMLTHNVADARALGKAIITNQLAPSEAGIEMTKALFDFTHQLAPLSVVTEASHHMMRYLIGDAMADLLNVPDCDNKIEEDLSHKTKEAMHLITSFENHSLVFKTLAPLFTKSILDGILVYFNKGKKVQFYIPPSLQSEWLDK